MQVSLHEGLYVEVYRNLQKKCWSVRYKGKVIWHAYRVTLRNARLVVQPAGNARVRRERVKNVHAVIRGYLTWHSFPYDEIVTDNMVTYNPYIHTSFVIRDTGLPIWASDMVMLDMDLGVYAQK